MHIPTSVLSTAAIFRTSTCGFLCLLYFQNFPELTSCASLCSRAILSFWSNNDSSLFTPNRELVSMRTYLASLSSSVKLLENRQNQWLTEFIIIVSTGQAKLLSYCGSLSVSAVSFNKVSWRTCKYKSNVKFSSLYNAILPPFQTKNYHHYYSHWGSRPCRSWELLAVW